MRLSAEEFVRRHEHCVSPSDKYRDLARSTYQPRDLRGGCSYPEDGMCSHVLPSEDELAYINAILGGTVKLGTPLAAYIAGRISLEALNIQMDAKRTPGLPDTLHEKDEDKLDRAIDSLIGKGHHSTLVPGGTVTMPHKRGRPPGSKNKPKSIVEIIKR